MAGPEVTPHCTRDRIEHERLTNSVQTDGEKQTSCQSIRVASVAVTRTGTGAGARAFGIQMDEHEPQPASDDADESLAWLDFLEECRQVLALTEQRDAPRSGALTPGLFETARRLHTRTA